MDLRVYRVVQLLQSRRGVSSQCLADVSDGVDRRVDLDDVPLDRCRNGRPGSPCRCASLITSTSAAELTPAMMAFWNLVSLASTSASLFFAAARLKSITGSCESISAATIRFRFFRSNKCPSQPLMAS
ncbi:hypothetical protein [Nocardia sp. NRRL S-836]|uniref:hypothetical protein n=1 Tax=Nocardia sp. NRRL S-836 TaxID=1519492 RepID=UPI0006AE37FA|nr:hypothetical protein [Nocardia sp. NRRL S-836]KOV76887.1 hypothetical protein ADL03_42310 [Nocardia sp. NRRL S-836]